LVETNGNNNFFLPAIQAAIYSILWLKPTAIIFSTTGRYEYFSFVAEAKQNVKARTKNSVIHEIDFSKAFSNKKKLQAKLPHCRWLQPTG